MNNFITEDELTALERHYKRYYDEFLNQLTDRQHDAFCKKTLVPKSKTHQKRYQKFVDAKHDWSVMLRRSQMRLVS